MSKDALFKNYQNQRWSFMDFDPKDLKQVMTELNLSERLAKILIHNVGSTDISTLKSIIHPDTKLLKKFDGISAPKEVENAIQRIKEAQKKNQTIYVNGDPDADGISGVCILVAGLRQLGIKTEYLFPIRPLEGHGLQVRIIDEAKKAGASLIITSDCGTKDVDAAHYAKQQGIDIIVTDHHILGAKLPDVCAVINPFIEGADPIFKPLSGASVSLVFIQAVYEKLGVEFPDFLEEFSYIVASFGTLSDRVSLLSPLNRLIVSRGVDFFAKSNREGIKALRNVSIDHNLTLKPRHLSRTVIPRLNAPGRIGNPHENIPDSSIVVDLLLIGKGKRNKQKAAKFTEILQSIFQTEKDLKNGKQDSNPDDRFAAKAASDVDEINEKRKYITAKIEEEMDQLIEEQVDVDTDKVIIVEGKDWNSGVIGIDTDRLKERFLRPAIILSTKAGSDYVRGSARSIPRINIYSIIEQVEQDFFEAHNRNLFQIEVESFGKKRCINAFGGHFQACGFTLHKKDRDEFKKRVKEKMETLKEDQFEYHYDVIEPIALEDINQKLIQELDQLSPFGQKFEFPIYTLKDCTLKGGRSFGNRYQKSYHNHVHFTVSGATSSDRFKNIDAIGFGLWEKFCYIKENSDPKTKIDLIFTPEQDPKATGKRNKKNRIRLNVLDIRIPEN